jgi:hypothetical protein
MSASLRRVTSRPLAEPPEGIPREDTPKRVRVSRCPRHTRKDCAIPAMERDTLPRVVTHGWGLW